MGFRLSNLNGLRSSEIVCLFQETGFKTVACHLANEPLSKKTYVSKETYTSQKRPVCLKRDLYVSKEIFCVKRHTYTDTHYRKFLIKLSLTHTETQIHLVLLGLALGRDRGGDGGGNTFFPPCIQKVLGIRVLLTSPPPPQRVSALAYLLELFKH